MAAPIAIPTKGMSREDWLTARKRGIGSSDAAAVAGFSPWRSPLTVYLDKTGQLPEKPLTEAMQMGILLEDFVAQLFTERTGFKVRRKNAILHHREHEWMLANVDREVIGSKCLLEAKTTNARNMEDWKDGKVPDYYQIQVQHQLAVTGYPRAFIAVLIGGQHMPEPVLIERDERLIEGLVTLESDFWHNHVLARVEPPFAGLASEAEILKERFPESVPDKVIELPPAAGDWIAQYEQAKAAEAEARKRKDQAAASLQALMGDAETAWHGDRRVNWKTIERAGYTVKPTTYRKFEVK